MKIFAVFLTCFLFSLSAGVNAVTPFTNINQYIENPAMVAENQERTHVPFIPYHSVLQALNNNKHESPFYQSLDGLWKFRWSVNPDKAPLTFFKDDFAIDDWDDIGVPGVWQMQGYGFNMYRNIPQALAPFDPPRVPDEVNPTGCYKRLFYIPESWKDRKIFIHFEGVKSASFVWVNGNYVGYDQGGMTPAEYDITAFIQPGDNTVSVMVIRWSDGSYLEDQDMWRFAGIYRNVYLYALPHTNMRDVFIKTVLDDNYQNGELQITCWMETDEKADCKIKTRLFDQNQKLVTSFTTKTELLPNRQNEISFKKKIKNPAKWSAEKPNLYTAVFELLDKDDQTLQTLTQNIGFRRLQVRNGQMLINGVAVEFMGVNRHEHHAKQGRSVPDKAMLKEIKLMKRFNINAVRTSHYPDDPAWYDLADRLGIYLQDEVNAECHFAEDWFADQPGWENAFMDRFSRMIQRDKNHPSVVLWSTGNECGLGQVHFQMAEYARRTDPTRLLYHQGNSEVNPPYVDISGPRYPSPARIRSYCAQIDKPVIMGEYMHAMGNSLGHIDEYWRFIRTIPNLQGGYIWDWIDQGLELTLKLAKDRSKHQHICALIGRPEQVESQNGNALALSGLDDWVEIYNDPVFDSLKDQLTLEARIYPRQWTTPYQLISEHNSKSRRQRSESDKIKYSMPVISKGSRQYGLQQIDANTIEFYVHTRKRHHVRAEVPADWCFNWHHLAGSYDGKQLTIYLDGEQIASKAAEGDIRPFPIALNIGRHTDLHQEQYPGWLSNAVIDRVRIFNTSYTAKELFSLQNPDDNTLLWLDFDVIESKGRYTGYGVSPFCLNGILFSNYQPQPELWQVKKSHQPVRVKAVDLQSGKLNIINYHNFTNLKAFQFEWSIFQDTLCIDKGILNLNIPPRTNKVVDLEYSLPQPLPGCEYRLVCRTTLRNDTPWASKGHEIAFDEFTIPLFKAETALRDPSQKPPEVIDKEEQLLIKGNDFQIAFNRKSGKLDSYRFQGNEFFKSGLCMNVWRPPTLNEWSNWGIKESQDWYRMGFDRIEHRAQQIKWTKKAKYVNVFVNVLSSASDRIEGFENRYVYTIYGDGEIILRHKIIPVGDIQTSYLPRLGVRFNIDESYNRITWYGPGPIETYPDRKSGAKTGIYQSAVMEQYVPYTVPQESGNKTDVRWVVLSNAKEKGLLIKAASLMNVNVTPFNNMDRAVYAFQLKTGDGLAVHIAHRVSGVGGTPVSTLPPFRVYPGVYQYKIGFKPVIENEILETSRQFILSTESGGFDGM